jgi:hypothetical protein
MVLLFRGIKSLAAANHGHTIRPRQKMNSNPNTPNGIASGIASTFSNFTGQHGGSGLLSSMNHPSSASSSSNSSFSENNTSQQQQQQFRSNTNSNAATTLFAGSYSFRELSMETNAPYPAPEGETLAIALNCLVAIAESLKIATIDAFGHKLPKPTEFDSNTMKSTTATSGATSTPTTTSSTTTSSSSSSQPPFLVKYRIIKPPSSAITKNKSNLSLEEFLQHKNESDQRNSQDFNNDSGAAGGDIKELEYDDYYGVEEEEEEDEGGGKGLNERQKEILNAHRACVRAFVSSTWEHFLGVVSELLLQVNSAVALAAANSSSHHASGHNGSHGNSSSNSNNNSAHMGSVSMMSGNNNNASQSHNQTSMSSTGSGNNNNNNSNGANNNNNNSSNKNTPVVSTHRLLLDKLLSVCVSLTISAGACDLSAPRDCLLGTLCKAAVPTPMISSYENGGGGGGVTLHNHNVVVLKAVLIVSHTLANSLGPAWYVMYKVIQFK